ncbi:MAG: hypothetical protein ACRBB6_12705 [Neptuniibacter sp.]
MDRIYEFMFFFVSSRKALVSLFLGVAFFIGINIAGDIVISRIHGSGVMAVFFEKIAETIGYRYDRLAWIALLSFLVLSVKHSIKDRKRLLSSY